MSENQQIEADEDSKRKIETMKEIASSLDEERPGNLPTAQKNICRLVFQRFNLVTRHSLSCIL